MSENSVINENEVKTDAVSDDEVLDKLAYTRKRYLTPKEIAAFVLVNFGQKNLSQFISANKDFFMVQFMGLSTTANANINLFSTVYDAVDDTLSGLIIDRTRTRWGRVRPFFILPLPIWIIGGLMLFSAPSISNSTGKIAWFAAATIIYGLGMSYFNAWNLMIYNITPNTNERNDLIITMKFVELFGVWLPSFLPIFVTVMPKISPAFSMQGIYSGFATFMRVFAAVFAIFGFFNMRERVPMRSREEINEVSVWQSFKTVFRNR
ncbi:MAG: MFS transporter, partial [Clostridia bacterium]|nr:MFS transporter [Clostridia bacterium]